MKRVSILVLLMLTRPAISDPDVSVEWHGLRAIGLAPDEQRAHEDTLARALVGRWFATAPRIEGVAARCGNNVSCHCDEARARGERYAAFGTAGRLGDSWSIDLTLIDTHACTVIASAVLADTIDRTHIQDRLQALGRELARPPETTAATAVKQERPLDRTSAIASTITAAQLTAAQMTTFADVLVSQPGFDVVDTNWGENPLVQGLRPTLLLVVDGVPQINGQYHMRTLGRDARVSMRNVDRIDFVRGPGSVVWGANAFLGVVHVVTRSARSRDGQVDAGLELGSSDSQELWANGAQSRGLYAIAISVDAGRRRGLRTIVQNSRWALLGVPDGQVAPWGNAGITEPDADRWLDLGLKLEVGSSFDAQFKNQTLFAPYEISTSGVNLAPGQGGYFDVSWRTYAVHAHHQVGAVTLSALASRFEMSSWESFAIQPKYPDATATDPDAYREGRRAWQNNPDKPRVTHQVELQLSHTAGSPEDAWSNQLLAGLTAVDMATPTDITSVVGIEQQPAMLSIDYGPKHRPSVSAFGVDEWSPYPSIILAGGARVHVDAPLADSGSWNPGVNMQGGAVLVGNRAGGKLLYTEGYRLPDGNSVFSTAGVKGNPALKPERSREVAAEAHAEVIPGVIGTVGGNLTRLYDLIQAKTIENDPTFSREPVNSARTDIASGFAELRWTSEHADATVRYGYTALDESNPIGDGIPYAPHNLFGALVVRPARDVTLFARSSAVSRRAVTELVPDGIAHKRLPWAVRLALGGTISNMLPGLDIDLRIDNPFRFKRRMPYDLTGSPTFVEDRTGSEAFVTLRWNH